MVNLELLAELAGTGPHATEQLDAANKVVLDDPVAPLADRIELVLKIVGRPMQWWDIADCLGEPAPLVLHTLVTHS